MLHAGTSAMALIANVLVAPETVRNNVIHIKLAAASTLAR